MGDSGEEREVVGKKGKEWGIVVNKEGIIIRELKYTML